MQTISAPIPLPDPGPTGAGDSVSVDVYRNAVIYITGAFTGSIDIEISMDGVNWVTVGSGKTAPGFEALPTHIVRYARLNVGALSAGTPTARIVGYNARS